MATTISTFKYELLAAYDKYSYDIAIKEEAGQLEELDKIKTVIANKHIDIILEYLYPIENSVSADTNFCTVTEIQRTLQTVNLIMGSEVYIDFDTI